MDDERGEKKPYLKPEIIYEADLEAKAGTPLLSPDNPIELPDS